MTSIGVAASVDDDLLAAVVRLLPQLSTSSAAPTREQLRRIVDDPATTLLIARDDDGSIVGMLTLAVFTLPTGTRAWIEDVVVDDSARGAGVGAALTDAAIAKAGSSGARTVELTSRPTREAANRLYQRLGFERRDTNVYRYTLDRS